jgi:hypothetical protein
MWDLNKESNASMLLLKQFTNAMFMSEFLDPVSHALFSLFYPVSFSPSIVKP